MPLKSWKIRIHDILNSVETIEKYTEGMRFEDFSADRKTVDAVMRHLIVLGEAAARMPDHVCEDHPGSHGMKCGGCEILLYTNIST